MRAYFCSQLATLCLFVFVALFPAQRKLYQAIDRAGVWKDARSNKHDTPVRTTSLGWLSIQLVGSIDALVTTSYGQVLLFKLILVNSILLLAARHKFKLVPALNNSTGREMLSKSISIEIVIALAILLTTSVLTSLVGPESYL